MTIRRGSGYERAVGARDSLLSQSRGVVVKEGTWRR